jgi:hypothetical protein
LGVTYEVALVRWTGRRGHAVGSHLLMLRV